MSDVGTAVLLVGLAVDAVDFEKWPQLTPESLEAAFQDTIVALAEAGYDAKWCLIDGGETAERQLVDALRAIDPVVVVIGAGVRTDPDHLVLFERVVNAAIRERPGAKIAFNTLPFDTVEAVQRWA